MPRPAHRRRRALLAGGWLASLALTLGTAVAAVAAGASAWWLLVPAVVALAWHPFMVRPGGVPVLVYHSVSADPAWLPWAEGISVSPEAFERHLDLLDRHGFRVVTSAALQRSLEGRGELPRDAVVLHFDDGYLDNWVAAAPLLERHRMPATVFVSPDFIEPGDEPRPHLGDVAAGRAEAGDLEWQGYMNRGELAALAARGLIDVQAHSTDHGRVPVGPTIIDELRPDNWRRQAWVQWARMPGPKWDWHRHEEPPAAPYGTPVPESAPALSARAWGPEGRESAATFDRRVAADLERCRREIEEITGREVWLFCWPQHAWCERGRELAREAGYRATAVGDEGENRPGDDPELLCRVHSGERALGFTWPAGDDLALYAKLRVHQGNYYWYPLLAAIHQVRRLVAGRRRPMGEASAPGRPESEPSG